MTDSLSILCHDESDTDLLGRQFADALATGLVVALNGQLGSGKTRFVRAVCSALGADPTQVNSPTFVLLQLYADGRIPVAHFDTYRLGDASEFVAIGAEDYLNDPEWISFVEWANRVEELLPADRVAITITAESEVSRRVELTGLGVHSRAVILRLAELRDASLSRHDGSERTKHQLGAAEG